MLKILKIYCFYQLYKKQIDSCQRANKHKVGITTTKITAKRQCNNCDLASQLPESNDLTVRTSQPKRKEWLERKRRGFWRAPTKHSDVASRPTKKNICQCCCGSQPVEEDFVDQPMIKLKYATYGILSKPICVGRKKSHFEKCNVKKRKKLNDECEKKNSDSLHVNTKKTSKATAASVGSTDKTSMQLSETKYTKKGLITTHRQAEKSFSDVKQDKQQSCPNCKKLKRNTSKIPEHIVPQNATDGHLNAKSLLVNKSMPSYGAIGETTVRPAIGATEPDRLYNNKCCLFQELPVDTFYSPENSTESVSSFSIKSHLNCVQNPRTTSLVVLKGSVQTMSSPFTKTPDDSQYNVQNTPQKMFYNACMARPQEKFSYGQSNSNTSEIMKNQKEQGGEFNPIGSSLDLTATIGAGEYSFEPEINMESTEQSFPVSRDMQQADSHAIYATKTQLARFPPPIDHAENERPHIMSIKSRGTLNLPIYHPPIQSLSNVPKDVLHHKRHVELSQKEDGPPKPFRPLPPKTNVQGLHKSNVEEPLSRNIEQKHDSKAISKPAAVLNKSKLKLHNNQSHVSVSLSNLSPHMKQMIGIKTNRRANRDTAPKKINQSSNNLRSHRSVKNCKRVEAEPIAATKKNKKLYITKSRNSMDLSSLFSTETITKTNNSTRQLNFDSDMESCTQIQIKSIPAAHPKCDMDPTTVQSRNAARDSSWSPHMRRLLGIGPPQKSFPTQASSKIRQLNKHTNNHTTKAIKPPILKPFEASVTLNNENILPKEQSVVIDAVAPIQTSLTSNSNSSMATLFAEFKRKTAGMAYEQQTLQNLPLGQLDATESTPECIYTQQFSVHEERDNKSDIRVVKPPLHDLQFPLPSTEAPKPIQLVMQSTTEKRSDWHKTESDAPRSAITYTNETMKGSAVTTDPDGIKRTYVNTEEQPHPILFGTELKAPPNPREDVCLGDIRQLFNVVSIEDVRRMGLTLSKQRKNSKPYRAGNRKRIGEISGKFAKAKRAKFSISQMERIEPHNEDQYAKPALNADDCRKQTFHKLCFYYKERVREPCQMATRIIRKQHICKAVLSQALHQSIDEKFSNPQQSVQTEINKSNIKRAMLKLKSKIRKQKQLHRTKQTMEVEQISRQLPTADKATQTSLQATKEIQSTQIDKECLIVRRTCKMVATSDATQQVPESLQTVEVKKRLKQSNTNTEEKPLPPISGQETIQPEVEILYKRHRFGVRAKSCHDLYSSSSSPREKSENMRPLVKYVRPIDNRETTISSDITTDRLQGDLKPTKRLDKPADRCLQQKFHTMPDENWQDLSTSGGSSSEMFVKKKSFAEFVTLPFNMHPHKDVHYAPTKYCLYEFRQPDVRLSNLNLAKEENSPDEQNHKEFTYGSAQSASEASTASFMQLVKQPQLPAKIRGTPKKSAKRKQHNRELETNSEPARSVSGTTIDYMGANMPTKCNVHNCGGLLTSSGLMAHYAHEHCDWLGHLARVHCQKIYANGSRRIYANYADFVLDEVRFLGMLAYGGIKGERLPAKRGLCATNELLPSSMRVLKQHLTIILYACKLNATRLGKNPALPREYLLNPKLAKNDILVVWAACYPLPFPLWIKVTVSDKHSLILHERSVRVRYFHDFSQEPRCFVANESDFLLLTYAEMKTFTKYNTSDIFFNIMIKEPSTEC